MRRTNHKTTIGPAPNSSPQRRRPNREFSLSAVPAMSAWRRPRHATVVAALLLALAFGSPQHAAADPFEWVGLGGDNLWTNADNWNSIVDPDALNYIFLTGASVMGPVTIDVDGSQEINRIEHQGVSGNYTFGETIGGDTITFFQTSGNALVNTTTGSDLIINSNIFLNQDNTLLRFDSVNGSDTSGKIIVHGDVAPAGGAIGTQTLVLTTTNKSGVPIVEVDGVISDGAGGAVLGINAGLEDTQSSSAITDHAGQVEVSGLNDFTGPVRVTGGTLVFDSIENVGSPDANALGMPLLADSTISIGDNAVTVGGIKYVGASTDSNTSDRTIHIASFDSATTIDASGTVPLALNGGITTAGSSTVRTLTLTGDNTDENTIGTSGIFQSGTGDINLVKDGIGTWVLSATNTYEGSTNVNDGELIVRGPTGTLGNAIRTIDVNPGGTLTVDGGTVTTTSLDVDAGATLNFQSGSVNLSSGASLFDDEEMDIGTDAGAPGAGTLSAISGSHTFEGITVSDSFDELSITGGTVNAESVDNSNGGTFTFTGGTLNLNTAAMGLTTGAGTIGGQLTGPGDVTKVGAGTLIHDLDTHDNSGDTNINEGTLQVTSAGRLSDGTTVNVASGATLELLTTSTDAIFGLNGSGDVLLGDANLTLGNSILPGSAGGIGNFSGTISDDPGPGIGNFEKRGSGTFTLAGQATHTGITDVENGEMIVTGSINGTSSVSVTNGALTGGGTLTIDGGSVITNGNLVSETSSSTLDLDSGAIVANQLDVASGASYASAFTWTTGLIHLTGAGGVDVGVAAGIDQPFQNSLDLVANKVLEIDNTTTVGAGGTLSITGGSLVTGNLDNTSGGTFSFDSGTLNFTQNQTFDATFAAQADVNTPIQAGRTLAVSTQATIDTPLVVAGGSISFGSVVNPENLILDSGSFVVSASDLDIMGGTSIDTSTGMTVGVTNGALNVATGGAYNAIGSTLNVVGSASTNDGEINATGADLNFADAVTNNAGGQINSVTSTLSFPGDGVPTSGGGDNSDGLTNNGDITLVGTTVNGDVHSPAGSNIFVGGTGVVFNGLVSGAGNFPGVGAVTFNGGYEPGDSPAAVTMSGDLALGNSNTLYIELDGSTPGSQFDQVNVVGDATIAGALDAAVGFPTTHQDAFQVMTYGSRSGVFSSVTDSGLTGDFVMAPFYSATDLTLSVELVGDASGNGQVGPEDYTLWADGFGMAGPSYDDGDLSRNGSVGPEDYTIWADNFGLMASSPESGPAAVPEPSTAVLAGMGILLLVFGRRNLGRGRNS